MIRDRFNVVIVFFLLSMMTMKSQNTDFEMATYNIGFGALVGGVGAVINKKPSQKLGNAFLSGVLKGSLGGYLIFESKRTIRKIASTENLEYAWPAKIVNSLGTSVVESAARNDGNWNRWHLHIGFNRIELDLYDKPRIKYRMMPVSFLLTAYIAFGNKFELEKSLLTGEFIFSNENSNIFSNDFAAVNIGNVILYKPTQYTPDLIAHEIIHSYQYYDFNFINTWTERPVLKGLSKTNINSKILDFFYLDLNGVPLRAAYLIENTTGPSYYDNFFEYEAGYWSNTLDR